MGDVVPSMYDVQYSAASCDIAATMQDAIVSACAAKKSNHDPTGEDKDEEQEIRTGKKKNTEKILRAQILPQFSLKNTDPVCILAENPR